jgi:hypothetical protein
MRRFEGNKNHREVRMNSPIRYSVLLGAVTLAVGVVAGSAFFAAAHQEPQPAPNLCTTTGSDTPEEAAFLAENGAAMSKMMHEMTAKPAGDVDVDFVAMMVPHHQGAIEMARAVLRYGRNPQIRRMAQEIIVTQQQEISAMRLAVGEPVPLSTASPTQSAPTPAVEGRASR